MKSKLLGLCVALMCIALEGGAQTAPPSTVTTSDPGIVSVPPIPIDKPPVTIPVSKPPVVSPPPTSGGVTAPSEPPVQNPPVASGTITLPPISTSPGAIVNVGVLNPTSTALTSVPVTFGQAFAVGDVPSDSSLVARLAGDIYVPLQVDVKATHPDGSLRHAVITALVPSIAANQMQVIYLSKSHLTATSGSTPLSILSNGFTASVNIIVGGVSYTASANEAFKSGAYQNWLSGPLATEWIVPAPFVAADGTVHPQLHAQFAIRAYDGNTAKVDVSVENGWAYVTGNTDLTYAAQVLIGGIPVYSQASMPHYHFARWKKTFWWGAQPQVSIVHNAGYLIGTKAVANYDQSITFTPTTLASWPSRYAARSIPMQTGLAMPAMATTGGRPDIGLMPSWSATYLLSQDPGVKAAMLGTADLAGSWSTHYRDPKTGRPPNLADYPYITINDPNLGDSRDPKDPTHKSWLIPGCAAPCATSPNLAEVSHQPAFEYLPYLVTGDYYYLEELEYWAMWSVIQGTPVYRGFDKGFVHQNQVRGQAWMLRGLADAAYIVPDTDSLKAEFNTLVDNNLDWYNTKYTNNPVPDNTLGFIIDYAMVYGDTGMAPWQDDFVTQAFGHVADLGYSKAVPFMLWKSKFPISRMIGPNFCYVAGAFYTLQVRDTKTSPMYTDIGMVYQKSIDSSLPSATAPTSTLTCGGPALAAALKQPLGSMTGYPDQVDGFPSNMQPALAYAADYGGPDGALAWKQFMSRTVKPNYSLGPQFAIVPRTAK